MPVYMPIGDIKGDVKEDGDARAAPDASNGTTMLLRNHALETDATAAAGIDLPDALVTSYQLGGHGGASAGGLSHGDLLVVRTLEPATAEAPPGTGKTLSASLLGQQAPEGGDAAFDLAADMDPAAGISHGTTVLAWARVDGTSPASGEASSGLVKVGTGTLVLSNDNTHAGSGGRDLLVGGITVDAAPYDPAFRGGITVAVGDVGSGDDVMIDGRIITAVDPAAASSHELGHTLGFRHEHTRPGADDGAAATDIIVAAGPGGGPHVKVFDASSAADGDGDVDGRDFLLWQRGGSAGAIGGGDLADWQNNYGSGGAASTGGADDDLLIGGLTSFDDAARDVVPTDQFSLNYGRVDFGAAADGGAGGVIIGLGDGSVRFVSAGIDPF
jgi:hypothetical protein